MSRVRWLRPIGQRAAGSFEKQRHDFAPTGGARFTRLRSNPKHDAPIPGVTLRLGARAVLVERRVNRDVGTRELQLGDDVSFDLPPARVVAIEEELDRNRLAQGAQAGHGGERQGLTTPFAPIVPAAITRWGLPPSGPTADSIGSRLPPTASKVVHSSSGHASSGAVATKLARNFLQMTKPGEPTSRQRAPNVLRSFSAASARTATSG